MTSGAETHDRWEGEAVADLRREWRVPLLEIHGALGSTNDRVRVLAREGAPGWTVVVAEEQTRGRGRGGRVWASPRGGLWMSILVRPRREADLSVVPLFVGVAAARAIEDVAPELRATIKWPNDVLLDGRKVAGVLCETWDGAGGAVVVGIGVNVGALPAHLPPEIRNRAVAVEDACGHPVRRTRLAGRIVERLRASFAEPSVTPALASELAELDALRGRPVRVSTGLEGTAVGIDHTGALLVEDSQGTTHRVRAGSVRVRRSGQDDPGGAGAERATNV